jgi:hypothetical protein
MFDHVRIHGSDGPGRRIDQPGKYSATRMVVPAANLPSSTDAPRRSVTSRRPLRAASTTLGEIEPGIFDQVPVDL